MSSRLSLNVAGEGHGFPRHIPLRTATASCCERLFGVIDGSDSDNSESAAADSEKGNRLRANIRSRAIDSNR